MALTAEQVQIASLIDARMQILIQARALEVEIFGEMADYMPGFKRIMDTTGPGDMDELCERFEGFYRYAKILETIAGGIASGKIQVPK